MQTAHLCFDVDTRSLKKQGEELCGDHVEIVRGEDGTMVAVLADGLGSGVKACILSTLTSRILSTMVSQSMELEDCIETIISTLPVCSVRGVAYSTFTVVRVDEQLQAEIIQYDNPPVQLLRDGAFVKFPIMTTVFKGREIHRSQISLREGDVLVLCSDGVTHAGVGVKNPFGWGIDGVRSCLLGQDQKMITAKSITNEVLAACSSLYDERPGDDSTVCALRVRQRTPVNLLMGPPSNPADVDKMMSLFFAKQGKHLVCGGTTSTLAAKYLGEKLRTSLDFSDPEIPPIGFIDGVDLVTEGVITVNRVLTYAEDYLGDNALYSKWIQQEDGASLLSRILFEEATDIHFYAGRAVNAAHQDPSLAIGFSFKMRLVEELAKALKKMGKRINVSYF